MEANLALVLIIFIIILLFLIFMGMPIAFTLGGLGIMLTYICVGGSVPEQIAYVAWAAVTGPAVLAIPLFILMGSIFAHSGLASKVYTAISPLICHFSRGGLLNVNIIAGALFAAASGSSVASTSTIGIMSLRNMESMGYERGISAGSVVAGGALGILIPPSITLIIYGAMCGQSVGRLFIAGIIPGIILTIVYMIAIWVKLRVHPHLAPSQESTSLKICLMQSLSAWPMLILIATVIGSMYLGIATATEAAAMGCAGAVVLAIFLRLLNWKTIKAAVWEAVRISSMILLLFTYGSVMALGMGLLKIPAEIMAFVVSFSLNRYFVLGGMYLMYILLGMFTDSLASIVITLPITFPILVYFGFDPIWGGIAIVLLDEMGMLTPPIGINLFIVQGLRPEYKFSEIVKGTTPFTLCIFSVLLLVTVFPQLATFLPNTMFRLGM